MPGNAETSQNLKQIKNIVAVASGKGGVAKSTTAVNIAMALNLAGYKVGLLDADIYGPSVPTMVRIDTMPNSTEDNRLIPAVSHGMKLISMGYFMQQGQAAIMRGPMVSGAVSQFLNQVEWGNLDFLIIDYPPGTGDIQLTLSQQAPITGALIVTTPQDISLADVERGIEMFEKTGVQVLGVCETMSYFICDECGKKHFIFGKGGGSHISRATGVPFLGEIPIDPKVAESGDSGYPIVISYPDSIVAQAYTKVAEASAAQLKYLQEVRGDYLETFNLEWNPML